MMSPPPEKVGRHVPRVPHQIALMVERMCVFGRSRKAKMLSRTWRYKNCYNFSSLQFFNLKLGRMLCNSCSNRFRDFYIFPIVGIGKSAINFQS